MEVCENNDNCQEEANQDNADARAAADAILEEKHKQLTRFAEEVREEYYKAYRQMISVLRPSHLDEFTAILMERQKHVVQNQDELICEMRKQLMHSLQGSLDRFWTEYDVGNRITELEMLKEQYKKFEGNVWNIQQKNPFQRTLPLRMRFKELSLRHLEKQLAHQNEQLENLMIINGRDRSRINEIEQLRKSMLMNLVRYAKDMEQTKPLVLQMTNDLINDLEKNLVLK